MLPMRPILHERVGNRDTWDSSLYFPYFPKSSFAWLAEWTASSERGT